MTLKNGTHYLTNEQFENFLESMKWDEETKENHRKHFKGKLFVEDDFISYE